MTDKVSGFYINAGGDRIELCSSVDAIMFGLQYFEEDVFEFYEFMRGWSLGTIEEWQDEFDKWKASK